MGPSFKTPPDAVCLSTTCTHLLDDPRFPHRNTSDLLINSRPFDNLSVRTGHGRSCFISRNISAAMRHKFNVVKEKYIGTSSTGARFNVSNSVALSALRTSLSAFKEVAGLAGVPGLQEGVKALVILLDAIQVRIAHTRRDHLHKLLFRKPLKILLMCSVSLTELGICLPCSRRQPLKAYQQRCAIVSIA